MSESQESLNEDLYLSNYDEAIDKEIPRQSDNPLSIAKKIETLNSEQNQIIKIVRKNLAESNPKQLLMWIHGIGGTGKSYVA